LKSNIINIVKEPKKVKYKELKEMMRTMSHQIENINNEIGLLFYYKKNQDDSEIENTITDMKSTLEGFNFTYEYTQIKNQET
jgi:hypothetical protein